MPKNKFQRWAVIVIVAVLSISLIGTSFVAIFRPDDGQTATDTEAIQQEYEQRKQITEVLSQKVEENPEDLEAKIALGDAYYSKAAVSIQINVQEYQQDLQTAIDLYQQVLAQKQDNEVLLKLANSAFLAGNKEVAEESYTELLKREPENIDALYGYGMYLFYDKEDPKQAAANWQKALGLTSDENYKKILEEMIDIAQSITLDNAEGQAEAEQKQEQDSSEQGKSSEQE